MERTLSVEWQGSLIGKDIKEKGRSKIRNKINYSFEFFAIYNGEQKNGDVVRGRNRLRCCLFKKEKKKHATRNDIVESGKLMMREKSKNSWSYALE